MNNIIEKIVLMAFGLIVLGTVITPAIMACALSNWRFFLLYIGGSDVADRIVSALIQVSEAIIKSIDEKDMSVSIGDDAIWDAYRRYDGKMGMIRGY